MLRPAVKPRRNPGEQTALWRSFGALSEVSFTLALTMPSRTRRTTMLRLGLRHPTPALVVSTVALILALGGTSYAAFSLPANSVGTRQIKNRAVTLAKIAPATQHALTKVGAQGNPGPQGVQGPQGPQGNPGPFPAKLPSAQTLTGAFHAGGTAVASNALTGSYISFAFPLASAPTVNLISHGSASTAACPGSLSNPQAAPGNFCFYESTPLNVSFIGFGDPVGNIGGAFSRFGGNVNIFSAGSGDFADGGSWAVTAP
jgi:hypothetical protein